MPPLSYLLAGSLVLDVERPIGVTPEPFPGGRPRRPGLDHALARCLAPDATGHRLVHRSHRLLCEAGLVVHAGEAVAPRRALAAVGRVEREQVDEVVSLDEPTHQKI